MITLKSKSTKWLTFPVIALSIVALYFLLVRNFLGTTGRPG